LRYLVKLVLLAIYIALSATYGPDMARNVEKKELELSWIAIVELMVKMARYESMEKGSLDTEFSEAEKNAFLVLLKLQLDTASHSVRSFETGLQTMDVKFLTGIYKKILKGLDRSEAFSMLVSELGNRYSEAKIKKLLLNPDQIKLRRDGSAGGPKETALEMMAKISEDKGRTYLLRKLKNSKAPHITDSPAFLEMSKVHFANYILERIKANLRTHDPECKTSLKFLQKNFPV